MSTDDSYQSSSPSRAMADREWRLLEKVVQDAFVEQRRARRWSVFFKLLTFGYIIVFLLLLTADRQAPTPGLGSTGHTALVKVHGVIADREEANANAIVTGLRRAFEHNHTKAVILDINSPGGSPVQSGYVYQEIRRLQEKHPDTPVYAVISDLGASGAYYIASAADEIYADQASLVGSIGVISAGFGFVEALDKLGIERRVYTAGDNKSFLDPFSEVPASQEAFWKDVLAVTHRQFVERVKQGRGDRLKDSDDIFSGLIWTGEQALSLGLVDGLASAGQVARDVVGEEKVVDFSVQPNPLDRLIKELGLATGEGMAGRLLQARPGESGLRY